jgi:hypothetical protein
LWTAGGKRGWHKHSWMAEFVGNIRTIVATPSPATGSPSLAIE